MDKRHDQFRTYPDPEDHDSSPGHPLKNAWTFWCCVRDPSRDRGECIEELKTVYTAEEFFKFYNSLPRPSALECSFDYCLFRKGIQPTWEDPNNAAGGRWMVFVNKNKENRNQVIDHYWIWLLLTLIGEHFDDLGGEICGATVRIRNDVDKISLWTRNGSASTPKVVLNIGDIFRKRLKVSEDDSVKYRLHRPELLDQKKRNRKS
ncbi:hypothetical protein L596_009043 [Steinernema carpocapsae]|nr:hypothetical protein L596_009043 [Steinernema carpocapsae]